MKEKILIFLKKHIAAEIMIALFIVAFIIGSTENDTLQSISGMLFTVSIIGAIVLAVRATKKKKRPSINAVPIPKRYTGIAFPEVYEQDGLVCERKYDYIHVDVVGSDYCGNVPLLYGEAVQVALEPSNHVDPEAVMLLVNRGGQLVKIGYLPMENRLKFMVNDFYSRGGIVLAAVDNPERYSVSMAFYYQMKK